MNSILNKLLKSLLAILLVTLFYFVTSQNSISSSQHDTKSTSSHQVENYLSFSAHHPFCQTPQTEDFTESISCFSSTKSQEYCKIFHALYASKEHIKKSEYSHYFNTSRILLIQYRKSDLIFPFHYFW